MERPDALPPGFWDGDAAPDVAWARLAAIYDQWKIDQGLDNLEAIKGKNAVVYIDGTVACYDDLNDAEAQMVRATQPCTWFEIGADHDASYSLSLFEVPGGDGDDGTSDDSSRATPAHNRVFVCPFLGCHHVYRRKADLKTHVQGSHPERPDLADAVSRPHMSKEGKPHCCPFPNCPSGYVRRHDLRRHLAKKHRVD